MPIKSCIRDNKSGFQYGDGVCFVGDGALEKAQAVGRAIKKESENVGVMRFASRKSKDAKINARKKGAI